MAKLPEDMQMYMESILLLSTAPGCIESLAKAAKNLEGGPDDNMVIPVYIVLALLTMAATSKTMLFSRGIITETMLLRAMSGVVERSLSNDSQKREVDEALAQKAVDELMATLRNKK